MRNLLTLFTILFFSVFCFAQKLSITENSNSKKAILQVELPKGYTLQFFFNDKLVKSDKFTGIQRYEIYNLKNLFLKNIDDKKNKLYKLKFNNHLEEFQDDLIIENQL